jgi:hypothetical protein
MAGVEPMDQKYALRYVADLLAREAKTHFESYHACKRAVELQGDKAAVLAIDGKLEAREVVKTWRVAAGLGVEERYTEECRRLGVDLKHCLALLPD